MEKKQNLVHMKAGVLPESQTKDGSRYGPWTSAHSACPCPHCREGLPYQKAHAGKDVCHRCAYVLDQGRCPVIRGACPPYRESGIFQSARDILRRFILTCPESFMIRSNCSTASRNFTTESQSVISLGRIWLRRRVLKSLRRRARSRVVFVRYRKQRCLRYGHSLK
jgi:hypothetical protein